MSKILIFIAALFLGIAFSTLLRNGDREQPDLNSNHCETIKTEERKTVDGRIEIDFAGWERVGENRYPQLHFTIRNGTAEKLYYAGYSAVEPQAGIKMGKKEMKYYYFGTEFGEFFIRPGETLEFDLAGFPFIAEFPYIKDLLKQKSPFTVGLNLKSGENGETRFIQTQPFALPDDFKKVVASLKD